MAIQTLRQSGKAKQILDLLKASSEVGRKLLIELTTWATDDLPGSSVLQQILSLVKRDAAIWLANLILRKTALKNLRQLI